MTPCTDRRLPCSQRRWLGRTNAEEYGTVVSEGTVGTSEGAIITSTI